jgi:hypothetical protein
MNFKPGVKMTNRSIKATLFALGFVATITLASPDLCCQGITGGYAGAFLRIGCGARALGMGGAFCGVDDDASSIFSNPAGLATIPDIRMTGTYALLSFDRTFSTASVAGNLGSYGNLAAGWIRYSVGEIPGTDLEGTPTGFFDDSENAFLLSYSRQVHGPVYAGVNAKFLWQNLAGFSASGYGFDFGVMVRPFEYISLGGAVQDMRSHLKWDTESKRRESIPTVYKIGTAMRHPKVPVVVTLDYEKQERINPGKKRAGVEVSLRSVLSLRTGYDEGILTAGASLYLSKERYRFGYAYRKDFLGDEPVHFFSLSMAVSKR